MIHPPDSHRCNIGLWSIPNRHANCLLLQIWGGFDADASRGRNSNVISQWVSYWKNASRWIWIYISKDRYPVPDVCIICVEELQPDVSLRKLPCEHLFHQPCIDAWVCDRDTRCPLSNKTFYHLRRLREGRTPSDQANYGRTGDRRGSTAMRSKFRFLKAWYRKRSHGQTETILVTHMRE
jgi:hypothetical protein